MVSKGSKKFHQGKVGNMIKASEEHRGDLSHMNIYRSHGLTLEGDAFLKMEVAQKRVRKPISLARTTLETKGEEEHAKREHDKPGN